MNFDTDVNEHHNKMKENIEKIQNTTDLFNTSNVKDIHLFFLYTVNQKLETFKRIDLKVLNNTLSKNNLLTAILKNKKEDGRKFNITGIYKYHFMEDLTQFMDVNVLSNSFTSLNAVEDINYPNNIELFQEYSSLFILLQNEKSVKTKRVNETKRNKTIRKV